MEEKLDASLSSSSTAKSSLQSDIGATSRRSKLGAERVFLDKERGTVHQVIINRNVVDFLRKR